MQRRRGEKRDNWLLIKSDDEAARGPNDPDILEEKPKSVVSGRTIEKIAAAEGDAVWQSNKSVAENVKQIKKAKKKRSKKATPKPVAKGKKDQVARRQSPKRPGKIARAARRHRGAARESRARAAPCPTSFRRSSRPCTTRRRTARSGSTR